MNIQNLADTLNTLAAARKFGVRAVADYGKEGTDEGIKFVTLSGSWIYTITRGGLDATAFAASAERNINEIGDRVSAADVAGELATTHLTVEQIDAIAAKPYSREYTEAMRSPAIRLGQKIEIRSKSGRTWPRFTDSGEPIGLPPEDDHTETVKAPYRF